MLSMLDIYKKYSLPYHNLEVLYAATDNRVGEISATAEISTSHTTVRTVPYTAVQST